MTANTVNFKGSPVPLRGARLAVGQKAPDFRLQMAGTLADASLADYAGKTLVLSVVPSLDTSVCALQTKRFNERAGSLGDGLRVLTVSMDLPFAQARFCGAEHLDSIAAASDHRDASFGEAYGVLIEAGPLERILARAVFVVGPEGRLTHVQYVDEIASEPDYDAVVLG